jgi:hypothetical protein
MAVLHRILKEAEAARLAQTPFLTAFDLDSTLFDLTTRMCRIVDAFIENPKFQHRYPRECELVRELPVKSTDWGLGEALTRVGLTQNTHGEFYRDLHKFWAECFFSNSFLHHDEPLPGAVEFVKRLRSLGAEVMYLSGRDVPRMLEGTHRSLKERGFPVDEAGTELRLKPVAEWDDAEFKIDVLRECAHRFGHIYLFENEPVNINLVAERLPDVRLVFIETCHSGEQQIADALALDSIKHFEFATDLDQSDS